LAGGNTSELLKNVPGFPHTQEILAAMFATNRLSADQIEENANHRGMAIPFIGPGRHACVYGYFDSDGRLMLGAGARVGANAKKLIVGDLRTALSELYPSLERRVQISEEDFWARWTSYSQNGLPFAYALDSSLGLMKKWPENPGRDKNGWLEDFKIIGIAGFGGQGNNFGQLGDIMASAIMGDRKSYDALRMFHEIAPLKPLTRKAAQKDIERERKIDGRIYEAGRRRGNGTIVTARIPTEEEKRHRDLYREKQRDIKWAALTDWWPRPPSLGC